MTRQKRMERLGDKVLISRLGGPRKLYEVRGMTANDWKRVYYAYLGCVTQVRCIVAEVEARQRPTEEKQDAD